MIAPAPRERIVRFGTHQALAGIISTPREVRPAAPFVVLVNPGIVHRVGPNRLYVDIARAVAARGYPVLRFDLSGLGDSEAGNGGASLTESVMADVRAAFDFLQQTRQSTSFVLCGLCSGANDSFLAAVIDPRIGGVVLIDPSVVRTRRSVIVHHARRLRHPATWTRMIKLEHPLFRRSLGGLRSLAVAQAAGVQSQHQHQPPQRSPQEIRAALQIVLDRGLQLMLVFTGGVNQQYNYRDQLFDLVPGVDFRQQLRLEFMPETDHTVSDRPSRAKLLQAIGDWMSVSFPLTEQSRASV